MNHALRRLVILHRAALGRWHVHARCRHALIATPGRLNRAAYAAASERMGRLDAAMVRLQSDMAAL